jgi:transcriptional regulator with XRE-family HTH domain
MRYTPWVAPPQLHVAAWRAHRGLTQEVLAERVGLHRVALSRIENGAAEPRAGTFLALAAALGTTCEGLLAEPQANERYGWREGDVEIKRAASTGKTG